MAIKLTTNFNLGSKIPLDTRLQFDTVANMAAVSDNTVYDGLLTYVKATKKYYTYNSSNTVDSTTGKWRELKTGSGDSGNYGGMFATTDTIDKTISSTTDLDASNISGLVLSDIVINETFVYDPFGTLGVITAKNTTNNEVTVQTLIRSFQPAYSTGTDLLSKTIGDTTTVSVSDISKIGNDTIVYDNDGTIGLVSSIDTINETVDIDTLSISGTNITYNVENTTQELLSAHATLTSDWTAVLNTAVPYVKQSGSFVQPSNGLFTIPNGIKVELIANFSSNPMGDSVYKIYNETDNEVINEFQLADPYVGSSYYTSPVLVSQWKNDTGHDVNLSIRCTSPNGGTVLKRLQTSLTIKEIGRIVDPFKYMSISNDTPVGNIISFMGNSVPVHYLECDGSIYNIADYVELASFITKEFGTTNYFGGNGTTTFAVPDLRGEFLRGTGTNSHANNGNGANVGVHQNATQISGLSADNNGGIYVTSTVSTSSSSGGFGVRKDMTNGQNILHAEEDYVTAATYNNFRSVNGDSNRNTSNTDGAYTTRPTNTSVKYCIKYESTYNLISSELMNGSSIVLYKAGDPASDWTTTYDSGANITVNGTGIHFSQSSSSFNGHQCVRNSVIDVTSYKYLWVQYEPSESAKADNRALGLGFSTNTNIANDYVDNNLNISFITSPISNNGIACFDISSATGNMYLKFGIARPSGGLNLGTDYAIVKKVWMTTANYEPFSATSKAETMLKPNTWPVGVEQDFGDGLYGQRFKGVATGNALSNGGIALVPNVAKTAIVYNKGGMFDMSGTAGTNWYDACGAWTAASSGSTMYTPLITNTSNVIRLYCHNNQNITTGNIQYDIWITYTKS